MRELEKPVARVFRRLRVQRFLATLVWSWSIALAIVAVTIGGEKLLNLTISRSGLGAVRGGRAGRAGRSRPSFRSPRVRAGWMRRSHSTGSFTSMSG